jgi:hypothetical protein
MLSLASLKDAGHGKPGIPFREIVPAQPQHFPQPAPSPQAAYYRHQNNRSVYQLSIDPGSLLSLRTNNGLFT